MLPSRFGPSCKPCTRSSAGLDLHRRAFLQCLRFSFLVGDPAFAVCLGQHFCSVGHLQGVAHDCSFCGVGYGHESAHNVSQACFYLKCPLGRF